MSTCTEIMQKTGIGYSNYRYISAGVVWEKDLDSYNISTSGKGININPFVSHFVSK